MNYYKWDTNQDLHPCPTCPVPHQKPLILAPTRPRHGTLDSTPEKVLTYTVIYSSQPTCGATHQLPTLLVAGAWQAIKFKYIKATRLGA